MALRPAVRAMAVLTAVAIAACSNGAVTVPTAVEEPSRHIQHVWNQVSIYAPGQTSPTRAITDGINGPDAMTMDGSGNLYVSNINKSTITVYARGATSPFRTIRLGRLGQPVSVAVDSKSDLFVASARGNYGHVTEYAPGSNSVVRRIEAPVDVVGWHDGQRGLAVDATGNLYAAVSPRNRRSFVGVYRYNQTTPSRIITDGVSGPEDLAFDRSGNLYVMNGYGINTGVYAPNASHPFAQLAAGANDVAFDSRGRIYVSLWNAVVEYAPDRKTVLRKIIGGGGNAIALDRYDNLYIASSGLPFDDGTVTVYSHLDGSRIRTIVEGVTQPSELLFDKAGNLYVASYPHYE